MASSTIQDEFLPGAASLLEHLDSELLLVLRDGRNIVGKLRSFDQYMNLALHDTVERIIFENKYCDVPLGLFLVRGDSIVLLGEVDRESEEKVLEKVSPEVLTKLLGKDAAGKNGWDDEEV